MPRRDQPPRPPLPRRPSSKRVKRGTQGAPPTRKRGQDFPGATPGQAERIVERRIQAFRLRKLGLGYREIGARLNVSARTAYDDIQAEFQALRDLTEEEARDLRALELERLDAWTVRATQQFAEGKVAAGFLLIKIQERRARLLGLDTQPAADTATAGIMALLEMSFEDRRQAGIIQVPALRLPQAEPAADPKPVGRASTVDATKGNGDGA